MMLTACTFNMTWWEWHFTSTAIFSKTQGNQEKKVKQTQMERGLQNTQTTIHNCQDHQKQKSLRNYHTPDKAKEI